MKKYLILAISALTMVTACSKSGTKTDLPESDEAMPIKFGTNIVTATVKSAGAVNQWNNNTVYVFGYDRTISDFAAANAATEESQQILVNNVPLNIAAEGIATVVKEGTDIPYYYLGKNIYDFYGYYIDDAGQGNVTYGTNTISFPVTINGKQDVMFAWADVSADIAGKDNVDDTQAYSSYSARRGVNPTLHFEHVLSQFEFNVKVGPNSESGKDVTIEELSLEGYNSGTFTAVGVMEAAKVLVPDETQEKVQLYLNNYNTDNTLIPLDFTATETTQTLGHLMMMPASEYKLSIKVKQLNIDEEFEYWGSSIKLGDGSNSFEPGYKYIVDIAVYGREKIDVNVTLEPWHEVSDHIVIDPDDPTSW